MRFFFTIIILMASFACSVQKSIGQNDIDLYRIMNTTEGFSLWFDVYDPISYTLNFHNDIHKVVFYTHHLNNNRVITKEYIIEDSLSLAISKKLNIDDFKECNQQPNYICMGLDGSEVWVQYKKNDQIFIRKYWSPEDQLNTDWGKFLTDLKEEISDKLNIEQFKKSFLTDLKRGRYWNYGVAQLRK